MPFGACDPKSGKAGHSTISGKGMGIYILNKDKWAMTIIIAISICLLLIFVKKGHVRTAVFTFVLAQLFTWPITLLYVQFGLQSNPVRLFAHATQGNFLFAFLLSPTLFTVYYQHYPKHARKLAKIGYTAAVTGVYILAFLVAALYTNLINLPNKLILLFSYILIQILYIISRIYVDQYLVKMRYPERTEK